MQQLSRATAARSPVLAAAKSAPYLPADIVDVKPVAETGAHQFFTAVLPDSGTKVFVKHNAAGKLFKHVPGSLLDPLVQDLQEEIYPNMDRLQDMSEVVLSNFARQYFERDGRPYSGISYQEVFFRDPQTGDPRLYIAAPMIEHLGTLDDIPASDISNPQAAVEQTLLRGLVMGDWNCTFRDQNVGVATQDTRISDGTPLQPGQIIDMDYGDAGTSRIESLDVPFGNRKVLLQYPQYIGPALERLRHLDRDSIQSMIDQAGQRVTGWTPELSKYYTDILASNVEVLNRHLDAHPHWLEHEGLNPMLHPGHAKANQFVLRIPAGMGNLADLKHRGILASIPSMHDLAQQVMDRKYPAARCSVSA